MLILESGPWAVAFPPSGMPFSAWHIMFIYPYSSFSIQWSEWPIYTTDKWLTYKIVFVLCLQRNDLVNGYIANDHHYKFS